MFVDFLMFTVVRYCLTLVCFVRFLDDTVRVFWC